MSRGGVIGVFLTYRRALAEIASPREPILSLVKAGKLMGLLHQFLLAAAVLALGIIGTTAIRDAAEAEQPGRFGTEYVVMFGIAGSLFLLAAYAPVRLTLYRERRSLVETALGPEPETKMELRQWLEDPSALDRLLGQDPKSIFGLGGVVTSLLPLVMGSAAKLLGGISP